MNKKSELKCKNLKVPMPRLFANYVFQLLYANPYTIHSSLRRYSNIVYLQHDHDNYSRQNGAHWHPTYTL